MTSVPEVAPGGSKPARVDGVHSLGLQLMSLQLRGTRTTYNQHGCQVTNHHPYSNEKLFRQVPFGRCSSVPGFANERSTVSRAHTMPCEFVTDAHGTRPVGEPLALMRECYKDLGQCTICFRGNCCKQNSRHTMLICGRRWVPMTLPLMVSAYDTQCELEPMYQGKSNVRKNI